MVFQNFIEPSTNFVDFQLGQRDGTVGSTRRAVAFKSDPVFGATAGSAITEPK